MNPNIVYTSYGVNPAGGTDQIAVIVDLRYGEVIHQLYNGGTINVRLGGLEKVILISTTDGKSKEVVPDKILI